MPNVSKDDFDKLHEKVDQVREDVSEIKGMLRQRNDSWTVYGVISAIILGIWNMLK